MFYCYDVVAKVILLSDHGTIDSVYAIDVATLLIWRSPNKTKTLIPELKEKSDTNVASTIKAVSALS